MKPIQSIPLREIDLSDDTFSVNYLPDLQRLRPSIEQIGLIQPVLLRKKEDHHQIVCGFRRISLTKELGKLEIESKVVEEKEMDEFQLFSLSLHENQTTRGFNTVEKAIALDKLIHRFQIDPAVVIKTFLPFFSLEPNEKILNTYLSLAQMEDEIKTYVLREEVSRSNIRRLSTLTSDNRRAILSLISSLKLGENRLKEVLTFLEEISRRNRCEGKDIVQRPEIQAILSQKELTPSQKTERIKKVLTDLRYPKLNQLEKTFEKKRKELNLPSNVSLHHPPFFEGKRLKIEFQFETKEEYRFIVESLSSLPDKKEFEEIIQSG
ncbi:MAG TPA: ParB/RepB/Spo0J family partition protein [Thermodesulfobacteriota bacterium]|nr:ParB/RepB/Spo0J family partition protein [Thermodesulfobacteriota bacterium]